MNKLCRLLRYEWPLHFVLLITNWLPDNVVFLRLRGALAKHFIGKCGVDLRIGRNVNLYNPKLMSIGDHVYIAYGSLFLADDQISIEDEVVFGPYCVLPSSNHTSFEKSFRYGSPQKAPISIGKGTWIGTHVIITAGSNIGENCLIAAGAVVTSEIPSGTIAGGIPAKVIKNVEEVRY